MLDSANTMIDLDSYQPASGVFCDGIEVFIGSVSKSVANKTKGALKNELHAASKEITVKNLLYMTKNKELRLWVTLDEANNQLTNELLHWNYSLVRAVKLHADLNMWNND